MLPSCCKTNRQEKVNIPRLVEPGHPPPYPSLAGDVQRLNGSSSLVVSRGEAAYTLTLSPVFLMCASLKDMCLNIFRSSQAIFIIHCLTIHMDTTQSWKELVELKVFWQMTEKHPCGFVGLFCPTFYCSQLFSSTSYRSSTQIRKKSVCCYYFKTYRLL